jgi:hypothetical protein
MKRFVLTLVFLKSALAFAQTDIALKDSLAKMVIWDQKVAGFQPEHKIDDPKRKKFQDSVFISHHSRLQKILSDYGYPGFDLVGKQGSRDFWLLVQHLDQWPDFQQEVLEAMKKQVLKKNASSGDYAYLTDRVRLNTNLNQLYGTQVSYNTDSCQAVLRPTENPESLNKRRGEVGLDRIEEYLNKMSELHFRMNKDNYEKRGIKGPKLYPIKEEK